MLPILTHIPITYLALSAQNPELRTSLILALSSIGLLFIIAGPALLIVSFINKNKKKTQAEQNDKEQA
jgi:hypothetical protein